MRTASTHATAIEQVTWLVAAVIRGTFARMGYTVREDSLEVTPVEDGQQVVIRFVVRG